MPGSILVFCFRSICQRTHWIPHFSSEHASAHVVSATSPPFEWYFPIRPNCVQVQQGGGVYNHPSSCFRFWWYLHLAVELKFILECPDHATNQSHCSLGQTISSMVTSRRCFQGGCGSFSASQQALHRCVWPSVTIPACPPTLRAAQPHAGLLLFSSQRGVQIPFLFVDPSRPTSVWHVYP